MYVLRTKNHYRLLFNLHEIVLKPHHQTYTIDAIHSRTYYCRNRVSRVFYVIGLRVIVFQVLCLCVG